MDHHTSLATSCLFSKLDRGIYIVGICVNFSLPIIIYIDPPFPPKKPCTQCSLQCLEGVFFVERETHLTWFAQNSTSMKSAISWKWTLRLPVPNPNLTTVTVTCQPSSSNNILMNKFILWHILSFCQKNAWLLALFSRFCGLWLNLKFSKITNFTSSQHPK